MEEETARCEAKDIEEENTEKDTYICNSCGREDDTGYFYCEECHRKHKRQKEKDKESNQKQEVR